MLNNLNQPKGSTIGVLKDGRTIQQAIDGLENPVHYVKDVSITPSALLAVAVEAARLGRTVEFGPGLALPTRRLVCPLPSVRTTRSTL
ncbi:hypothetical protein NXH46_26765, partial [Klebsiella pneumoniae]|nr:hypothetical protein [Klebsiella pneumoniae]